MRSWAASALNLLPFGIEAVQIAIQRIIVERRNIDAQNVAQGRAADPVGHRVFRPRRDQAVERHRLGQQTRPRREAGASQDPIELQLLPDLMAHVHRAGGPRFLERDVINLEIDPRARRPRRASRLVDERRIRARRFRQRCLTVQGGPELVRKAEPRLGGSGFETAQRTDDALARSTRRVDRFDEEVVGVGLVLVAARRLAQIHSPLFIPLHLDIVESYHAYFSHYLLMRRAWR